MHAMDYKIKLTGDRPLSYEKAHANARVKNSVKRDLVTETESNRGRVIQSAAVRRLQQKTQVYPLETNASVRSRLTHSLEVQQTGRYLAKTILQKLSQQPQWQSYGLEGIETAFTNLVEMACLLHDVGNPPFGHFGEEAISAWVRNEGAICHQQAMQQQQLQAGIGGNSTLFKETLLPDLSVFEGNAQGLRIICSLQNLNLTWSQLASVMKYTRMPSEPVQQGFEYRHKKVGFYYAERRYVTAMQQQLAINKHHRYPLVYIMEAADDISYCIADLEDAMDKNILSQREVAYLLRESWQQHAPHSNYLPAIIKKAESLAQDEPHLFIYHLRSRLVRDLVGAAAERYCLHHQAIFDGAFDEALIDGHCDQNLALMVLKQVAVQHVFDSLEKETPELRGYAALTGLLKIYSRLLTMSCDDFALLAEDEGHRFFVEQRLYHRLPTKYVAAYQRAVAVISEKPHSDIEKHDLEWYYRMRLIIDYISGMTDHFVLTEYQSLSAI